MRSPGSPHTAELVGPQPMSAPWVILGRVETDNPAWVPGQMESPRRVRHEVREHLEHGGPGLYGDLPPGGAALIRVAAAHVARAFAAYAQGDWEACDRLLAEGYETCGETFTAFVEHVVSPALSYRVDDPAWGPFLGWLAITVPPPVLPAAE
jgi:hypothetical protein